jgi:twitching motility two-component system response regulator PilH
MARVLVVDDSPTDQAWMKQALSGAGHAVLEAASGNEALQLVRSHRPDCVVMDLVMPGINGFEATRTLSRDPLTAMIPVIIVSSKDQDSDRHWALRQGARAYLTKPLRAAELLVQIHLLLRLPGEPQYA